MIRFLVLLVLLVAVYSLWCKFWPTLKQQLKPIALVALSIVLLLLAATGKLNWLLAAFGVLVAGLFRTLPWLLRYAPELQRLWYRVKQHRSGHYQASSEDYRTRPNSNGMDVIEAYQILGLSSDASREEIIMAHKKLMQKVHPDRGGSAYIAAQINQAKDLLLKLK